VQRKEREREGPKQERCACVRACVRARAELRMGALVSKPTDSPVLRLVTAFCVEWK